MKFIPRSEETRQHIIESTAELFNKKGVAATSISDLEKATGMTRGSIYGNFENKDAVALAAFDFNWKLKRKILSEEAGRCSRHRDKLLAHVLLHYPSAKTRFTAGGCPLQNTTVESDDTDEIMRNKAAACILQWTKDLAEIIEKGIKAKEFKAGTDAVGTAVHIISLIEGAALFGRSTRDIKYVSRLLDTAKTIVDGIVV